MLPLPEVCFRMSTKSSHRRNNLKYYPEIVEKIHSGEYKPKKRKKKKKDPLQIKHNESLEKMKMDTSLIGIEEIVQTPEIEFYFERKRKGQEDEKGEADLVTVSKNIAYYVEYKCNDCPNSMKSAKKQLLKAKRCINGEFERDITKLLYVRGDDFKTDELKGDEFLPFNYTPSE
jgi:hypothetical protein